MQEINNTYESWTYREIECRLYRRPTPDSVVFDGYVKFGDEWLQAIDGKDIDEDDATSKIESFVDTTIMQAKVDQFDNDDVDPLDDLDPIDVDPDPIDVPDPYPVPNPPPEPVPDPEPYPKKWDPLWIGDRTVTIGEDTGTTTYGTTSTSAQSVTLK